LFLSFFGKFSSNDLPFSVGDTANSIISNTFAMKNKLVCVDDYKLSGTMDMRKIDNTAQALLRGR
jgi:hypothetical protein